MNQAIQFRANGSHLRCLRIKNDLPELAGLARLARLARLAPGNGVKNQPPDPISTRAGGQDDVS